MLNGSSTPAYQTLLAIPLLTNDMCAYAKLILAFGVRLRRRASALHASFNYSARLRFRIVEITSDAGTILCSQIPNDVYEGFDGKRVKIQNGIIKYSIMHADGRLHGYSTRWNDSGIIHVKASYRNDTPHGDYLWYDSTGRLSTSRHYSDGKLHGECTHYYYDYKIVTIYDTGKPRDIYKYTLQNKLIEVVRRRCDYFFNG